VVRSFVGILFYAGLRVLAACVLLTHALSGHASTSGLVISQVYGGSSNSGAVYRNDFVELFNGGASAVSLSGMSLQYGSATGNYGNTAGQIVALPAFSLQPGQHFLVQLFAGTQTGAASLPAADHAASVDMAGASGKVALVGGTAALGCGSGVCTPTQLASVIDRVSYGAANNAEASAAPAASGALAPRRRSSCQDSDDNLADFQAATPSPRNSSTAFAPCTFANAPIVPICPAVSVAAGTALSVTLTATDADSVVNAAAATRPSPSFTLSSLVPAASTGGTLSVSLDLPGSLAAGAYAFGVTFGNDASQTASCTVAVTVTGGAVTRISAIQGAGSASPLTGQTVTTEGVVTFVTNNGFYIQDLVPDADPATSEGVFVFTSTAPPAQALVGNELRLTGTVVEFNTLTQLTGPTGILVRSSGVALAPVDIVLPEVFEGELERYEGMLVRIVSPLTVSQNYFLGRYGQATLSAGGRLYQPTQVHRPGTVDAIALAAENARRRLVLDDGSSIQNPDPVPYLTADGTLRAGDTVVNLTGVIDHGLVSADSAGPRDYKITPTVAPVFVRANPRRTAPPAVGGNVKVAAFNVLNYFSTVDQSGAQCLPSLSRNDCRGADSAAEQVRQRDKIVAALRAIDADVVGLMEIQRNGQVAVDQLVAALNAAIGTPTYSAVVLPANMGTDAIQVAMIHKPARVVPVGPAISDTDAVNNRPTLAQGFVLPNGERFAVAVNHMKSKSCSDAAGADADQSDGQGCWNERRTLQARRLQQFVSQSVQIAYGTDRVLLLGDLNSYAKEDPIEELESAGFENLALRFDPNAYSYTFDGNNGTLDYALASPAAAARVSGAVHWAINSDEPSVLDYNVEFKSASQVGALYAPTPYRSSDHDPVVVGLSLVRAIDGTGGRDTITGTPGDDRIEGGPGADTLTGGAGRDVFVYTSVRDGQDTIMDFVPGVDRIDLSALLVSIAAAQGDAVQAGVIRLNAVANGTLLSIDADGSAGPSVARPLVLLRNVSPAQIVPARDYVLQ
jgi:predicted extracellular nuclease